MSEKPLQSEDLLPEEAKRETGVSRLVGFSGQEEKAVLASAKEVFEHQVDKRILEGEVQLFEREKTQEEIQMISSLLSKMPEFIQKYGGDFPPVTVAHIHILDREKLSEEFLKRAEDSDEGGAHVPAQQFAYIYDDGNFLKNAHKIVHELMHFSSFQSFEKAQKEFQARIRRTGFEVHNNKNDDKEVYFTDINEAIIEELTKRFDKEFFSTIPQLEKEIQARKDYLDLKEDDFFKETKQLESGEWQTTIIQYSYPKQRKRLKEMIKAIYEKNVGKFDSEEGVFEIFAKAVMTGKLLEPARLVEETYGKGSLRKEAEKK